MSDAPEPSSKKKRKLVLVYWGSLLVLIILGLAFWLLFWRFRAYTDDAYVEGNQVYITPLIPGFVTAIHTDDTFLVEEGQLLVELDRTDAEIAYNKAQEELGKIVRQVSQSFHDVFIYKAEIDVKKAELIKTIQDYQHREGVLSAEGVSVEDYEHAVAALRASYFALQMSKALYKKALSFVQGTTIKNHPLVLAAADSLRYAWVQLYRCNIHAPVEGLAAQRTIQVGMWIDAGKPLMSVIPLDQIWVNANFKETQLKHMRIGQKARITSDYYGADVVFHGKVVGLPGGAGNAFSLLPPQNLSGNWIKIVQRLPVRIELDPEELKRHPLRIGLSMEVLVDMSEEGLMVPDSTKGSPTYCTSIFEIEEKGDENVIQEIINQNLDPTLEEYSTTPLVLEPPASYEQMTPELESLIQDRLQIDLLSEWVYNKRREGVLR